MPAARTQLVAAIGDEVVRFQDESAAFDDAAALVLAVERADLPCMTLLLFGGPASRERLAAALQVPRASLAATIDRLQLAGYVRRRHGGAASAIELTEHARQWIEKIWSPLREEGGRLLNTYSSRDLATMRGFMSRARQIQERQTTALRGWLRQPAARRAPVRGGLSPAALRRVQVFVEANLAEAIRLRDLAARAGLSLFHFSRAFRTSAGMTPRAFIEARRVERARHLLDHSGDSLAQIALACGLGSQSRFTTTFKRRTRFTPAQYRRRRA